MKTASAGFFRWRGACRIDRVWSTAGVERWRTGQRRAPTRAAAVLFRPTLRPGRSETHPLAERAL